MKLAWSEAAQRHLHDIREFIAQDNPAAADALVTVIAAKAQTLQNFPFVGRARGNGRRVLALPPTHYSLIYRVLPDQIVILAVWHGARRWP